jgi:hypothetical protein
VLGELPGVDATAAGRAPFALEVAVCKARHAVDVSCCSVLRSGDDDGMITCEACTAGVVRVKALPQHAVKHASEAASTRR